jgi:hypothetical protein
VQFGYYSIEVRMEFLFTALPSDVRKWLCPSVKGAIILGAGPRGIAPKESVRPITEGHSHLPHIRRQSRSHEAYRYLNRLIAKLHQSPVVRSLHRVIIQPFRVGSGVSPNRRVLPWAKLFNVFGVKKLSFCHTESGDAASNCIRKRFLTSPFLRWKKSSDLRA